MSLHNHLLKCVVSKPQDYEPFGIVKKWEDENKDYSDCSCGCKYFIPLEGELRYDWGICSNKLSHRCGLLTFEHQGCDSFEKEEKPLDKTEL